MVVDMMQEFDETLSFCETLHREYPEMKFLICAAENHATPFIPSAETTILEKPFNTDRLLKAIRCLIDES
jgi:DNA-binding NtrC family response regulator